MARGYIGEVCWSSALGATGSCQNIVVSSITLYACGSIAAVDATRNIAELAKERCRVDGVADQKIA